MRHLSRGGDRAEHKRYPVKIPPGVKDGTRVRQAGKGQGGVRGGKAGDLIVITRVTPSRVFDRKGDDLSIEVPVTISRGGLGAQIEIPTIDGRVKLKVPPARRTGVRCGCRARGRRSSRSRAAAT